LSHIKYHTKNILTYWQCFNAILNNNCTKEIRTYQKEMIKRCRGMQIATSLVNTQKLHHFLHIITLPFKIVIVIIFKLTKLLVPKESSIST